MKRLVLISLFVFLTVIVASAQSPWATITGSLKADSSRYKSVDYLPSGVVWIAGGSNPYTGNHGYRSTDHGSTWTKFILPNTSAASSSSTGISNISALDANTALVGLATGQIIRTTNGGAKWDTVFSYTDGWIDGVMYLNSTIAVAYGDADQSGLMIARSTNAGASWTRVTGLPTILAEPGRWIGYYTYGQGMDVYNNTIWATVYDVAGVNPYIAKSTDAGVTWTGIEAVLPGGPSYDYRFHAIAFKDDSVGYGICRGLSSSLVEYVTKTTNGGKTWSDTISVEKVWPHNMADPSNIKPIRGTNTVIALGGAGSASPYTPKAWRSTDNGANWTLIAPGGATGFLINADFIDANRGFAVGTFNAYKYSVATEVEKSEPVVPIGYNLAQNYPNPFNPTTKISYSVPKTSFVELKVYDLLGRTVATLVNIEQAAGTHTVGFDAKGLSSGVYLYTMKAGDFTATKSLVLIK